MYQKIEAEVKLRTKELEEANIRTVNLNQSLQDRLVEIEEQKKLGKISVENAYDTGKAEIAVDTLHNIGNILNSVTVSTRFLMESMEKSAVKSLHKVNEVLSDHSLDLAKFFTHDPKSKLLIQFLLESEKALTLEIQQNKEEIGRLLEKIDLITQAVNAQQSYVKSSSSIDLLENVSLTEIVEQVILLKKVTLQSHQITIVRNYIEHPLIFINKSKLFYVLVNLIKNARESLDETSENQKTLTIETNKNLDGRYYIKIADNGLGISEQNFSKLFTHGFTTKQYGHGFGLHFCALTLREYRADIVASSKGLNQGCEFTITFAKEQTKETDCQNNSLELVTDVQ